MDIITKTLPANTLTDQSNQNSNIDQHSERELSNNEQLKVLTYNIWNNPYQLHERVRAITREIRNLDLDLIALQEVTSNSIEVIFEDLADFYHVIENFKNTGADHGIVILINRFKFNIIEPYRFDFTECTSDTRHILGAKIERFVDNKRLDFLTTHLESNSSNDHLRLRQRAILDKVANNNDELEDTVIFAGTCNGYKHYERSLELSGKYRDVWISLGCSPSLRNTFEGLKNPHLSKIKFKGRLDKIIVRGKDLKEKNLTLIGVDSPNCESPSDHYGLIAQLNFK